MREIEFRGQELESKIWVFGVLAICGEQYYIVDSNTRVYTFKKDRTKLSFEKWSEVNPHSVGQFTGLVDRNGIKAYDGDIVRIYQINYHTDYRFYWNKTGWHLIHAKGDGDKYGPYFYNPDMLQNFEVVGNIYDNPELCK